MDYWAIRAWGAMFGSSRDYINRQIDEARADKAPQTAIYKRDGVWHTADDIKRADTLVFMNRWANEHGIAWSSK